MKKSLLSLGLATVAALSFAMPALAQYKVVGPDGKITYTDRPPPAVAGGNVTPVRASGGPAASSAALPAELRDVVQRYPVTLYTVADCAPCDAARTLLRTRGIPYSERLIVTGEDSDALQRIAGSRDAPTLTIGAQAMRGFSSDDWNSYLDSAGYPRDSRLPPNYQYAAATPLTERRAVASPQPRPASLPQVPPSDQTPLLDPSNPGIKF
jgi:glutaredoxin